MDNSQQVSRRVRAAIVYAVLSVEGTGLMHAGPLLILMAVLPALWAATAFRARPFMLGVLALTALLSAYLISGSLSSTLLLCAFTVPAGAVIYLLQRFRFGNFYTVFFTSVVLTAGLYAYVCGPSLLAGGSAFDQIGRSILTMGQTMQPVYDAMGMGAIWAEVFSAAAVTDLVSTVGVAVLYAIGALVALSNTLLLHAMNRSHAMPLCPLSPFERWNVPRGFVFGSLALMLIGVFAMTGGAAFGTALVCVIFVIWVMPMALVGLSVLYGEKKRLAPVIVMAVLAIPLYLYVPPLLALIAMFGRRPPRRPASSAGGDSDGGV